MAHVLIELSSRGICRLWAQLYCRPAPSRWPEILGTADRRLGREIALPYLLPISCRPVFCTFSVCLNALIARSDPGYALCTTLADRTSRVYFAGVKLSSQPRSCIRRFNLPLLMLYARAQLMGIVLTAPFLIHESWLCLYACVVMTGLAWATMCNDFCIIPAHVSATGHTCV